ncbi:hypothetical protein DD237_007402 [Peronospora effusa]|uniref:G-protein coupled receptors family 3 profile domain-containing protein n=1 Tax=Peronospora effusa TaxID=542832 RepID=A0A3R7XWL4_9STRA|nr:hypothetical protein DD237_007402 [Peronospora effusa]
MYILGLLWFFLHPAVTLTTGELKCRGTYMSENALLIDLMEAKMNDQETHLAQELHQDLLTLPDLKSRGCQDNCSAVIDWIDTQLRRVNRAETYHQEVQIDGLSTAHGALDGSDGYAPGTEAWLQAYHLDRVQTSGLQDGLPMRAGIIRAAVNLETMFDSHHVEAVGIYAAGMNGQLPNLDLVNTAVRAFRKHKIPTILDRADVQQISKHKPKSYISSVITSLTSLSKKYVPEELKQGTFSYLTNLEGMLNFMTTLASGPSGPHANFISYNIDSITLSLTTKLSSGDRQLSTREVLRSLEMVIRALSNLEEKLHQSFYLYVLPSTTTFVSVGEYFYAVALTISPAIVHLLSLANQTTGMRVAFALAVFFTIETLCVLFLVVVCHYFATPTALLQTFSPSDVSATRWLVLAVVISVVQALVIVIIMPALRSVTGFSGCVESYAWRTQVMTYEAEQQKSLSQEFESIAVDAKKREFRIDIPDLDSGWRAIKFITMAVLVYVRNFLLHWMCVSAQLTFTLVCVPRYSHCILGILNYPMALFGAIPMTHFASVIPFTTATRARNTWSCFWLFLSSPLVLVVLLNWSRLDVIAGLSYAVDSFVQRTNLLALPYVCCIYTSVHTLSLAIWMYPAPQNISSSEKKVKQE